MTHRHVWIDLKEEEDGSVEQYCECGASRTLPPPRDLRIVPEQEKKPDGE